MDLVRPLLAGGRPANLNYENKVCLLQHFK